MGEEFSERSMREAAFRWVDLTGARFERVYLRDAHFNSVDFSGTNVRNALFKDVSLNGDFENLTINGVDVMPLIEAELDRRHPERLKLRPTDAGGFRDAWPVIEDGWAETVATAEAMDPALLHERVDGEWSFIETLRHLLFATDAWVSRFILGDPSPWHPLDLPFDDLTDSDGMPWDRESRPSLPEVLALRRDRMSRVARVIGDLTDEQLAGSTAPVPHRGWPQEESFPVRQILKIILNEEFWHRQFAERDLAALRSRRA
jgi:hypothetical protein